MSVGSASVALKGRAESRPGAAWWASCIALVLFGGWCAVTKTADHDVAYWIDAAGRLLDGARLYRDLIELNPPTNYLLTIVPVAFARAIDADPIITFHAAVVVLAVATVAIAVRIAQWSQGDTPPHLIAPGALFAFLLVPGPDFGQREHILAILLLPYLVLAAGSAPGHGRRGVRLAIGAMAGLGIAFKPYFALYLVAVEAVLAWRMRSLRQVVRIELAAAAAVVAAFGATTLLAFPDYLAVIVPLGRTIYHGFETSASAALLRPHNKLILLLFSTLLWAAIWGPDAARIRRFASICLTAAAAGVVVYMLQMKGWRYQALPPLIFVTIGLGHAIGAALEAGPVTPERWPARRVMALLVMMPGALAVSALTVHLSVKVERKRAAAMRPLIELVAHEAHGAPVLFLSTHLSPTFPVVNYAGARWPHRYHHLLPLPGLYDGYDPHVAGRPFRAPAQMDLIEARFFASVVEDAVRYQPRLILVDRRRQFRPITEIGFDMLAYFRQDEAFARLLTRYRYIGEVGRHDVFQRTE